MRQTKPISRQHGLTVWELLALSFVITLLLLLLLPALYRHPRSGARIYCIGNLKQIGLGFRMWSADNTERFPMAVSTNQGGSLEFIEIGDAAGHFRAVSNELNSPKVLACSEDHARHRAANFANFSSENLSYFVALDASEVRPETILAGERTFTTNGRIVSGVITVSRETKVTFAPGIHQGYGNIALVDGSAQRMENRDLSSQAVRSTVSPFRVQIP